MGIAALMLGAEIKHSVLAWSALPANLLMAHAWGFAPEAGWNHPSWSISAEWFAYLCFPAFAYVAWRLRGRPNLAVGGALVLLFALYALFEATAGFPLTSATIRWGFLRIVPCFAYGCAIYLMWRAGLVQTRREAELGVLAFLGCVVLACQLGAPDAATVSAFGGLILALAGLESTGSSWLTSRTSVYLGEVSYGLYMVCIPWQMLYLNGVQKALHLGDRPLPVLLWLGLPAGAVLAAIVAHHTVERPARLLMRRLVEHGWRGPRDETSRNPA
jgi:peptidoglycan/LPS O-acetylase OafA/YrhL